MKITNKLYWYGFGAAIIVVVLIVVLLGMKGNTGVSSKNENPPALPNEEQSSELGEELTLPGTETNDAQDSVINSPSNEEFVGSWRVYSQRIFYDEGGAGSYGAASEGTTSSTKLEIKKDKKWSYGSSSGTWEVSEITDTDWSSWKIDSYGPTRKMTLEGWNKGIASGPIEEDGVNFIWVIYRVQPPISEKPGMVNMKFGH